MCVENVSPKVAVIFVDCFFFFFINTVAEQSVGILVMMAEKWPERIAAFSCGPSRFLSETSPEAFLAELLRELRDDRATHSVKVKIPII